MTYYSDTKGRVNYHCISTQDGRKSFCGEYRTKYNLADSYESIWEVVELGHVNDSCSCKIDLARHLGFASWDEAQATARKIVRQS